MFRWLKRIVIYILFRIFTRQINNRVGPIILPELQPQDYED